MAIQIWTVGSDNKPESFVSISGGATKYFGEDILTHIGHSLSANVRVNIPIALASGILDRLLTQVDWQPFIKTPLQNSWINIKQLP